MAGQQVLRIEDDEVIEVGDPLRLVRRARVQRVAQNGAAVAVVRRGHPLHRKAVVSSVHHAA